MDKHPENMSLENFEIAIVKQVPPRRLKREELHPLHRKLVFPSIHDHLPPTLLLLPNGSKWRNFAKLINYS